MDTKVCKKCGVEKLVSNFSKGGKQQRANGEWKQYYHSTCKQCVNTPRVRKDNLDPKVCNICCTSKSLSSMLMMQNVTGIVVIVNNVNTKNV